MAIELCSAGWDFTHERGFTVDRPQGLAGEWLLLQFTRPAFVHGLPDPVVPASRLVLWAPGQSQRYTGHGCGLGNHWCHARGLEEVVGELGIRTGEPQQVAAPVDSSTAFQTLVLEQRRQAPGWHSATAGVLVAILRAMADGSARSAISDLRGEVLSALDRPWKISALAARSGCSVPTLHRRWRKAFGCSPVEDIIRSRIDRARWLIAVAGEPVAAAARAVGYADARYFARLCRIHRGVAPSSWAAAPRA